MNTTVQEEVRPTVDRAARQEFVAPAVNIFETKDGYVLEAEMPGVTKEGLEVTLEGNEITIIGRRQTDATPGELLFRERRLADYHRVFELSRCEQKETAVLAKGDIL